MMPPGGRLKSFRKKNRTSDDADEQQAAHRRRALLDLVRLGALDEDPLAHADVAQEPDVGGHQDDDDREREQDRLDQLDAHQRGFRAELGAQRVDEQVQLDAARRLDEHDVAVAEPARGAGRAAASRSRASRMRDASRPAALAPAAIPLAPGADDDQQVARGRGRGPDLAMAGRRALAQLEHLAEDRDAPARAGRPAGRAPPSPTAARRCRCRR